VFSGTIGEPFLSMESPITKIENLVKEIKVAMFTTMRDDGTFHSRPMMAKEIDEDLQIWFFTSDMSTKAEELRHDENVSLTYSMPNQSKYLSINGRATIVQDKEKAEELWNPIIKAWFKEGLDDPNLTLVKVEVDAAEYWDAPNGKMVQLFGLAKAAITGKPYLADPAEHHTFSLKH
jgi:general stress protein 26